MVELLHQWLVQGGWMGWLGLMVCVENEWLATPLRLFHIPIHLTVLVDGISPITTSTVKCIRPIGYVATPCTKILDQPLIAWTACQKLRGGSPWLKIPLK